MVNWVLVVVVLALVFVLFKTKEVKHKFATFILIALLLFFIFTFSQVSSRSDVDFNSFDGVVTAGKLYFSWLGQVFSNLGTVTGNAVKLNWTTNFTEAK